MNKINEFTQDEKQYALKVANELMKWKVFEMNDCDTVAAKNEEEAKAFYEQFIEREEIEEYFGGEANFSQNIRIFISDLSDIEREKVIQVLGADVLNEEAKEFYCTLLEWLEIMILTGQTEPFIIASTEY